MARRFEHICNAMAEPGFYPDGESSIKQIETHISVVFLTEKWVYKLKKPVRFDFLDFTRLTDRHYFCSREIILNQRLSHGIYMEVVPIYEISPGQYSLTPSKTPVEYAVKMRRLPDECCLKHMLESDDPDIGEKCRFIGQRLSRFYQNADRSREIDGFGKKETLSYNLEENIDEIEPFVDDYMEREQWQFICQISRNFLNDYESLFDLRIQTGRIRDGHGDLRPEHIYFYGGLQIIDCIEFNDRFRYGDTVLDLAFLYMELDHLGHAELGREILKTYAAHADDRMLYALIDYYCAYRALVRVKVCCLSLRGASENRRRFLLSEIHRYFDQAFHYCLLFGRPTLWVFFGPPASGKSTMARCTGDSLLFPVFRSDLVRKQEMPVSEKRSVPYGTGIYRESMRDHIYTHLFALAQERLKSGASAILDATFSKIRWRDAARRLALDLDANLIFVHCSANRMTLLDRLKKRETGPNGDSDARLMHFDDIMAHFDPVSEQDPDHNISIDTRFSEDDTLHRILSEAYALKNAQITKLIGAKLS
ncbi:MAG: AAA family ATPase [Desulfobacterales bacterium]